MFFETSLCFGTSYYSGCVTCSHLLLMSPTSFSLFPNVYSSSSSSSSSSASERSTVTLFPHHFHHIYDQLNFKSEWLNG
ncbi:hypothetical protein QVD17_25890 [Tagetes erecta]|uniref:Uncharacterized protein n=1 Tax=Tagetes erecta TaxID=13708 RepID=A0AAD8K6G9_TARER|nr:hypothetical protein QVD17_25890 [Tagetes erecta]